jgi:hypothetical protein
MKIFLAPRSNETSYKNFLSTIDNGVDFNIVEPYLEPRGKNILSGQKKLFAWGSKEIKKPSWDKMEVDDLVLFYVGRDSSEIEGKFVYAGKLLYKQYDRNLGLALWPPKPNEEPWTCVFFLRDLTPVYIPISTIQRFGDYDKRFDRIQGFMPLNEKGTDLILKQFGNIDNFINKHKVSDLLIQHKDIINKPDTDVHSEAQMLLLKIGIMLGYQTYSPNKSNIVFGEALRQYISLNKLPNRYFGDENFVKVASQVDVIWFKDDMPIYAFEVENSTKIGSGLQRLFSLEALKTKLFIIAPAKDDGDYKLFVKYLDNAPYFKHKESFKFKTYRQLEDFFRAVSENTEVTNTFLNRDF